MIFSERAGFQVTTCCSRIDAGVRSCPPRRGGQARSAADCTALPNKNRRNFDVGVAHCQDSTKPRLKRFSVGRSILRGIRILHMSGCIAGPADVATRRSGT